MRLAAAFALLIGLGASAPAHATTGLVWKMPAEGLRYFVVARVNYPLMLNFQAEINHQFRASEFQFEAVTECKPTVTTKTGWELQCRFEDVSLLADPVEADETEHVQGVLTELEGRYEKGWVQVQLGSDGRVRSLDLEDVEKGNQRTADIHELMRLIAVRAFAGLDLELPKNGDDKGKGAWKNNSLLANQVPSSRGTQGMAAVVHQIAKAEGGIVEVNSQGKGVISTGDMQGEGATERPLATWDITYAGYAKFDTNRGILLEREFLVDGAPTASSVSAPTGRPYVSAARVQLLEPGQKVELSPTGKLPPR
jgi:hypothetical protein